MSRENITDILCIGCQKGSTSWLHSVLNTHPATFAFEAAEPATSTNKEAHYWDWNRRRGPDWYRALMTPPDPALRSMDFTPEYAFLSEAQIADSLRKIGRLAGMDDATLDECLNDVDMARTLTAWYQKNAQADEISATPTLLIDGEKHSNMTYADLQEILDGKLEG